MKKFFKILLSLSLVILSNPQATADYAAPMNAPKGISQDVWDAFYTMGFNGHKFTNKLLKWGGSGPSVAILGNAQPNDVSDLSTVANQLKKLCGIYSPNVNTSLTGESDMTFYVVPKSDFTKYISSATGEYSSYAQYTYYATGSLSKVKVVLDSETSSGSDRTQLLIFRLIQGLGLWGTLSNSNFPFFNNSQFSPEQMSEKDRELFTLFCTNLINSGDSIETVAKTFQNILLKTPNQVPQLKASAQVTAAQEDAEITISLNSLKEILTSGVTTLNWQLLNSAGIEIDKGEFKNSENRLKSVWKFNLENLKPNSNYKISYNFSNIIGTSKSETTKFQTEQSTTQDIEVKEPQEIVVLSQFTNVNLNQKVIEVLAETSSGLTVEISTKSPKICATNGMKIELLSTGNCNLVLSQPGNDKYEAAEDMLVNFSIKSSSITITCVKGKVSKKITGASPKCPSGFKKKS